MTAKSVALKRRTIERSKPLVIDAGPEGQVIDVIYPVGPGTSGSLAQLAPGRSIRVEFDGERLSVVETLHGRTFQRPKRTPRELRAETMRVNLVGRSVQTAFLLTGYQSVSSDD